MEQLERDLAFLPLRVDRLGADGRCRAVDEERIFRNLLLAPGEDHLAGFDLLDPALAHHVPDLAQPLDLAFGDRGVMEHFRLDIGIDAQHDPVPFQLVEERGHILRCRSRCHQLDLAAHRAFEELFAGLRDSPVDQPAFAWFHPGDTIWCDARFEEPDAGIHRGFSRTQDDEMLRDAFRVAP